MSYKYFSESEFRCRETGENDIKPEFIHMLDELRERVGHPLVITSGFRSLNHSAERSKKKGGTHTQGIAADIAVSNGVERMKLVKEALAMGFGGIGVSHSGGFVHVDMRTTTPVMWTYS
jgi:uncharacterized protein YcbK (DUF882 family)